MPDPSKTRYLGITYTTIYNILIKIYKKHFLKNKKISENEILSAGLPSEIYKFSSNPENKNKNKD